jgi:hypothetical protein
VDYGHEEAKMKHGKDPRTYAVNTKVFPVSWLLGEFILFE